MILGFLIKYRDYRVRVHTGPGGDSYIMALIIFNLFAPKYVKCDRDFNICSESETEIRAFSLPVVKFLSGAGHLFIPYFGL